MKSILSADKQKATVVKFMTESGGHEVHTISGQAEAAVVKSMTESGGHEVRATVPGDAGCVSRNSLFQRAADI